MFAAPPPAELVSTALTQVGLLAASSKPAVKAGNGGSGVGVRVGRGRGATEAARDAETVGIGARFVRSGSGSSGVGRSEDEADALGSAVFVGAAAGKGGAALGSSASSISPS